MTIQILQASEFHRVAGGVVSSPVYNLLNGHYVSQGIDALLRTYERLAPGGADDGTWSQIGASGLTA